MKSYQKLAEKRQAISGKYIVGIDPSKFFHQAQVLDPDGALCGRAFRFDVSDTGFTETLWKALQKRIPVVISPENTVFAIEHSCNLWQTFAAYLHELGYTILLVNPFTVYRLRPTHTNSFSKDDSRDAFIVGDTARQGIYSRFRAETPRQREMLRISIEYNKMNNDRTSFLNRITAALHLIFPEFPKILPMTTKAALALLKEFQSPADFVPQNRQKMIDIVYKASHGQKDEEVVDQLIAAAKKSVGIKVKSREMAVFQTQIVYLVALIEHTDEQMEWIMARLIEMVHDTPAFKALISFKGISDTLAALFLAETRELEGLKNRHQIEKYAGYNLITSDSGQKTGTRRISPIGNKRLRKILYQMAEGMAKYIPEVRNKFLNRQLKRPCYRKNIVASITVMLNLILAVVNANRTYEFRKESMLKMQTLDIDYQKLKKKAA